MRRPAALLALAAIPVVLAGCGDDDSDSAATTSTTALTKAQFIREANKICKQTDDKIERASQQFTAGTPGGEEPPPSEVEQFGEKTVYPAIQDEIDRIRALGAPEGDEDQVNAILTAAEQGLEELKQNPKQIAKGGAAPAFEQAQKLAGEYGLDQCASG